MAAANPNTVVMLSQDLSWNVPGKQGEGYSLGYLAKQEVSDCNLLYGKANQAASAGTYFKMRNCPSRII